MQWTDEQMDQMLGTVLRAGVIIAASVVLVAGVWYLVRYGEAKPDYHVFQGEPAELRGIPGILRGVCNGQPQSYILVGLVLLIAPPVVRVVFCVIAFGARGDRTYVSVTLIVLTVLLYSLANGL